MRAAIYVRVSTGQQAKQDLSIPDQIAQCETYCAKREWDVVTTFTDAGASATIEINHLLSSSTLRHCFWISLIFGTGIGLRLVTSSKSGI